MKLLTLLFSVGLMLAYGGSVGAATRAKKSRKKVAHHKVVRRQPKAPGEELQTDVKFDDSVLHGQYQTPEEALAKVENEKALSDLIGVRKHFKDRLNAASEQE